MRSPGWEFSGHDRWDVGFLAAGESRTAQLRMPIVDPSANHAGELFLSAATAGVPGSTPVSAMRAGTIDYTPGLRLALAPDPGPVASGVDHGYTLTFGNASDETASNVMLQLPLPAGTSFVSATGGGTPTAGVVRWSLGSIPPGEGGEVRLVVNVGADADDGTLLFAQASASANGAPTTEVLSSAVTPVGFAYPCKYAMM